MYVANKVAFSAYCRIGSIKSTNGRARNKSRLAAAVRHFWSVKFVSINLDYAKSRLDRDHRDGRESRHKLLATFLSRTFHFWDTLYISYNIARY